VLYIFRDDFCEEPIGEALLLALVMVIGRNLLVVYRIDLVGLYIIFFLLPFTMDFCR
jgi:hypothetical protein